MLIGYINKPNLITLTGLSFALSACMLAARGYIGFAMIGLMFSGICDYFDGAVARKTPLTPEEQAFGAQLDTLNDVVCFGLLPVVLIDSWLQTVVVFPVFAIYLIAVLYRLAYFNLYGTTATESGLMTYTGLPVTTVAGVMPLVALPAAWIPELKMPVLLGLLLLLAALYIYKQPIPKLSGKAGIALPVLALVVSLLWFFQPWGSL